MRRWRKAMIALTVLAILGISVGYPASQLVRQWSQDHPVVVVEERDEGGHDHNDGDSDDHETSDGHEQEDGHGPSDHEHDGAPEHEADQEHGDEADEHEHDLMPESGDSNEQDGGHEHEGEEGEAEHLKPAFETYGLVRSEPGYKEFNLKLSQFSFTPDTIRVQKGDRVRLNLDSVDVEHGIALDGYDGTIPVPVEKVVTVEFVAKEGGALRFRCAVTCGAFHPFMVGRIVVEPETTFPWAMFLIGTAPLALFGGWVLWRRG